MRVSVSLFSISLLLCVLFGVRAVGAEEKKEVHVSMDVDIPTSDDPKDMERAQEIALLYLEACISAYPEMDAIEKFVAKWGFQPLPEMVARSRISGFPGRGWVRGQPDATDRVELILEDAPNQGCAVWVYGGHAGSYYFSAQLLLQMAGVASGDFNAIPYNGNLPPAPENQRRRTFILAGPKMPGTNGATITVNTDPDGSFRARLSRFVR